MIYLFAVMIHIFPPSGYVPFSESMSGNLLSVAMPTFIMGTQGAGLLCRFVRSSLLEVLGQDYIRTAYAKGLHRTGVILRHAVKPAMIPVVTIAGLAWGYVVAGSFHRGVHVRHPGPGAHGRKRDLRKRFPGHPGYPGHGCAQYPDREPHGRSPVRIHRPEGEDATMKPDRDSSTGMTCLLRLRPPHKLYSVP